MTEKQIIGRGLINAVGVFVYIVLVSWLMSNGEKLFSKMNSVAGAAVGGLIIGRPLMLYQWYYLHLPTI